MQWMRAHSFEGKSLTVEAGMPQLVTIPLTVPVAVIRAQVRNRFGEPITHYTGSWDRSLWSLQQSLDPIYVGEKDHSDLTVSLKGVDGRLISRHPFVASLPLGQVTDVTLTVPIP